MQAEAELWTTVLFNRFLAAPLDAFLNAIGQPPADPAHPWENWLTMEILVVAIILVLFAFLRSRLSVDKPGKLQLTFEAIYNFVAGQAHDAVEHGRKYVPFFGTLFIFILFMNLIGIIPGFESPTMTPAVPLGLAVAVFLYYHWMGLREQGVGRYLPHFAGPMPCARTAHGSDRVHQPSCAAALAHRSSFREHVRGRKGHADLPVAHVSRGARPSSWGCTFSSHSYRLIFLCCSP